MGRRCACKSCCWSVGVEWQPYPVTSHPGVRDLGSAWPAPTSPIGPREDFGQDVPGTESDNDSWVRSPRAYAHGDAVNDALLAWAAGAAAGGVLVAQWRLTWGALLAGFGSLAVSYRIAGDGGLDNAVLFRDQAWFGLAELLALGLLAGRAARSLPIMPLAVVLLTNAAAVLAIMEWRQGTVSNPFVNTALLVGLAGCVGAGGLLRRSDLARARAADQARAEQRLEIARELHDVVAHHVTAMVVQAQAGQLVTDSDPDRAASSLASVERAGVDALAAMRRMVGALRTDDAAPTAPAATLADLDELVRRSGELGLAARLTIEEAGEVPPEVALSVHRVVREALTNARRHATDATAADVRVERRESSLEVVVTDDGRPTAGAKQPGFGLVGMAERVQALGGSFSAGPRSSGGWEVKAVFPLLRVAP